MPHCNPTRETIYIYIKLSEKNTFYIYNSYNFKFH